MLLMNAEFINFRLKRMTEWQKRKGKRLQNDMMNN